MIVDGCCLCYFFLYSLFTLNSVSVVFDFNALLNDVVPVSPIQPSVHFMRTKKRIDDGFRLCVCVCPPFRLSFVSVVFIFNASLNVATQESLI